jgi:predicted phage terminase large subunit-like protein
VKSFQHSALQRNLEIKKTAELDSLTYGREMPVYVEQEPGSGGKEATEALIREMQGFNFHRDLPQDYGTRTKGGEKLPGQAKINRARLIAAQCEGGNVHVKRAGWNANYIEKLCAFPESKQADEVDATSGAYNVLTIKILPHWSGGAKTEERVAPAPERHGIKWERTRK